MTRIPHPTRSLLAAALGLLLYQGPALAQQAEPVGEPANTQAQPAATPDASPQGAQTPSTQATDPQQAPADAPAAQADDATNLDAVTVTGYRYSIEKSLDQKRNANAVVEVVTAEDISKFPDKNVADALQRTPGVVITRDGGEGKNVSVRGLQPGLTLTQLNGNYIATSETNADPSRSFNYTLLPANMLSSAELFKSPEARLDEGGIGGTVILHTRRPLDMEANTGFGSIEFTRSDTSQTTDPQASAMYSWHSEDERWGLLVGMTKQDRTNRSMTAEASGWDWYGDDYEGHPATDVNGKPFTQDGISYWWGESGFYSQNGDYYTNFYMPTVASFGILDEKRERSGSQLTFQFKPLDNLTLTANYFRFDLKGEYALNQTAIPEWNLARYSGDGNWPGGRMLNGLTFDPSGTIVTGAEYEKQDGKTYYCSESQAAAAGLPPGGWGPDDCTIPTPWLTGRYSEEQAKSETADLAVDWDVSTLFKASFKGGRTKSEGGPTINFRMSAKPRKAIPGTDQYQAGNLYTAWDLTGTPSATFSPDVQDIILSGIAEIDAGSTDSSWTQTTVQQDYFQADFDKLFESGWLDSIQFGAKYTNGEVHRNTGNNYWVCPGSDPDDYGARYQAGCDPEATTAQPRFFYAQPLGDIAGGFNVNVFPGINYPAYLQYLTERYGPMQTRQEEDFVYNVDEKVTAGYIQVNFRTERLRGNLGVRVAKTKQIAESTNSVERFTDYFLDGADGNPLPCTPGTEPAGTRCESGFARLPDDQARSKSFSQVPLERTYTDVLPSFNIAYDLTEDLVLRGSASKVISRPSYTSIAAPGALNYFSEEYSNDRRVAGGTVEPGWTGSGSNPDLEPFEATQYDLGLEWYFQPGSVLGLGLFRKDIKNFVVPVVNDRDVVVDGETVNVRDYGTNVNGQDGVSQGVELYAQHTFDFGLGFQANYTYNDTNLAAVVIDGQEIGESPLVGSAKNQANLTVFYETQKFLARASFNHRGEVVGGLNNGLSVYTEPYDQLDLNFGYNFTEQLGVTASVLNATRSEQRTHLGNDTKDRFLSNSYSGRIYYLGVTYKF